MTWLGPVLSAFLIGSPPEPASQATSAPIRKILDWEERDNDESPSAASLPVVIVLHGRGQTPQDLAWLAEELPPCRLVLLEGPVTQRDGSAWFSRRLRHLAPAVRATELAARAQEVAVTMETRAIIRPSRDRAVVVGYSQGASVALALAWLRPDLVGEVVAVSAFQDPSLRLDRRPSDVHFRFVHGLADERLSARAAREAVRGLEHAGVDVSWRPVRGSGHRLDGRLRRAMTREIRDALSSDSSM